jgi:hypothetical protein
MDFGTALAHYTCVFEYKGGTYIRQFWKEAFPTGVSHAITDVLRFLECPVTEPGELADVGECWRELVAIEGLEGVWYSSILAHNALFEVLVIRQ